MMGIFDIRVSWRGPDGAPPEQAKQWTILARDLLQEALTEWGVERKTSSGYGRLADDEEVMPKAPHINPADIPKAGKTVPARLLEEKTKRGEVESDFRRIAVFWFDHQ